MELVNNNIKYWDFIRNLRNDKRVNSGFIEDTYVSEKQQIEYMKKYSSCYRIALIDGNPVGYVGVIDNDIRICTHPDYQGMGVGKFMLNNCMKIWPHAEAKVKISNIKSLKLFETLGFSKQFYLLKKDVC
mgnify:CR=1 FL=1|jgi:ribosomal protein S18 acetylase RimI-like enzyme